jgi:hypothetical protein
LVKLIPPLLETERAEIEPAIVCLLQALKADDAAKPVMAAARIKLDVKAGGHILLECLEGATDIDVKADAAKDFVLSGVKMRQELKKGN